MNKLLLCFLLTACCGTTSAASQSDPAFDKALARYAQSSARDLMSNLIEQHASGTSWKIILGQNLPKSLDDRCGYREKLNLPEDGFIQMRDAVMPVAGDRMEKAFSPALSRPGARLALVEVRPLLYAGARQALVVTSVIPSKPGDRPFGLLYQLDSGGRMSLCDVTEGSTPEKGILYNISKELNR